MLYFGMKRVWYNGCFVGAAAADGLVLQHQGHSGPSADLAPMCLQFFVG